jgi:DNA-binding transcriptional LysR family regulator
MKEYPCEFVVITPKNVRDISKEALGDLQPMLSGDSCFFGRAVMGLVANLSLDSQGFSYIHSIESIVHCVSAGIGFSVLPKCLLDKHPMRSELSCHKYPGKARFSFYKVCLQSRKDTKLLREISKYI